MEELKLNMEIDLINKKLYIGEETGAGAKYKYTNINDLADKIKFYFNNYYFNKID